MPNPAFLFAVVLCLIQTEGAHAMSKLDQNLEEAVAAAQTPEQMFPVLILCAGSCAPVLDALRDAGDENFAFVEELNLVTTKLSAKSLANIATLDAVASIELDAEASID